MVKSFKSSLWRLLQEAPMGERFIPMSNILGMGSMTEMLSELKYLFWNFGQNVPFRQITLISHHKGRLVRRREEAGSSLLLRHFQLGETVTMRRVVELARSSPLKLPYSGPILQKYSYGQAL